MSNSRSLKYEVKLLWDGESGGEAHIRETPALKIDMPVEFGGRGRFPCPDELFFSAVGGCLLTTFLYFKEKLRFFLRGLQVSVKGIVNLIGPKGYRIAGIEAFIRIEVDEKEKLKAEKCAELTRDYCHITRSLEQAIPLRISSKITCVH